MEIYGFVFSIIELIAFGCLFVTFFYQLYFYLRYVNGVLRLKNRIKKNKVAFQTEQLPVSVIICAKDEVDNLRKFLPFILEQEYPDFEVIVINDGSTDETEDLLSSLCKKYAHLRTTFVPVGAKNLSTKKLGITLGVKAAKYDLLLFTDADCLPEDKLWISRIARNYTPETEFVLGYGAYLHKKGFLNRLIRYDTLFIALQYMGMAIARKPYMGVGRNLSYRKETFYKQKGFASTLHLRSGDDDLMVNRASNSRNTRVEISPDSVTWSEPNTTYKAWRFQKERHLSVSSYYKGISKFRLSLEPFSRGIFYISLIVAYVTGNLITTIASTILFLTRYIMQLSILNGSAKHFDEKKHILTLPLFDIFLPMVSLYILTVGKLFSRGKAVRWK